MSAGKGQASMMDILLLGLFVSILIILSVYFGNEHIRFQVAREDSSYVSSMLQSTMSYTNSTYGSYQNNLNLSVAEAINLFLCTNKISEQGMNETLGRVLNSTVRPGYNYIFYTSGVTSTQRMAWVWNSQPDVCARYILVKEFDLVPSCNVAGYQPPILGIWPSWKPIPRKSACSETGPPVGG
jgi:hypothetical protein